MRDYIIRFVPGYGFLPIVEVDGKETFRGSYKDTPEEALVVAIKYGDS